MNTTTSFDFVQDYRVTLHRALDSIDLQAVAKARSALQDALEEKRNIFVCGNGGSASTASHFACDLVKGASYRQDQRFRIMALTDSLPTITAYSNDVSYACVFVEQLKNFASARDVVIAISGSGNSKNVVSALELANNLGCTTIALTGRDGGQLGEIAQIEIRVPDPHMGRIEDGHLIICHMLAYSFMDQPEQANWSTTTLATTESSLR